MNNILDILASRLARLLFRRPRPWRGVVALALAGVVAAVALAAAGRGGGASDSMAQDGGGPFQLRGRVVHVADGDTFTLLVDGRREKIRMASIDAPEVAKDSQRPGQPVAQASRKALGGLIAGKTLALDCYERDHYQRSICDVPLADGSTANRRQVQRGMAWANMEKRGQFLRDARMPELEREARQSRLGIWGQGRPVPPWVWRYQCWKQAQC